MAKERGLPPLSETLDFVIGIVWCDFALCQQINQAR